MAGAQGKQRRLSVDKTSPWNVQEEVDDVTSHGDFYRAPLETQTSIVDGLLCEIYDRWHDSRRDSIDSDTFTECSSTSEFFHCRHNSPLEVERRPSGQLRRTALETQTTDQLMSMVSELQHRINQTSGRLVRQLKRRDRRLAKLQHNSDIVTAILQASSLKRRIDTRMRFTIEPPHGDSAFDQWKDAMKAVARLPLGIPDEFRKKVWLSLADSHIDAIKVDWEKTVRFAFNERSNPDDNTLGLQIVKDLHRTGCSGFSGQDNEEDRAVLKRVLLAYARWNKQVGYCQGFNIIAAFLLEVMDHKEDDALKVMIYLIDHVLPDSYFDNNLRALSVDMAVFRDLLRLTYPTLSRHLDYLQYAAQDQTTGACYEPPLTNVFTMQWFLSLFATCLPKQTVLRVWDSILLEGSEVLLRTALIIWGKLSSRILTVGSADEFYTLMGDLTQEMVDGRIIDADTMIKCLYSLSSFPFPQLAELREKYTYNIRPFSSATGASKKSSWMSGVVLPSDEDDLDDDDIEAITCFTGILPNQIAGPRPKGVEGYSGTSAADISVVGPGAYGAGLDMAVSGSSPAFMERMTTDISALKQQYSKLKQRQNQAHIILAAATAKNRTKPMVPKMETPRAMNHLFVGKHGGRNRYIAEGPRIAPLDHKPMIVQQTLHSDTKRCVELQAKYDRRFLADHKSGSGSRTGGSALRTVKEQRSPVANRKDDQNTNSNNELPGGSTVSDKTLSTEISCTVATSSGVGSIMPGQKAASGDLKSVEPVSIHVHDGCSDSDSVFEEEPRPTKPETSGNNEVSCMNVNNNNNDHIEAESVNPPADNPVPSVPVPMSDGQTSTSGDSEVHHSLAEGEKSDLESTDLHTECQGHQSPSPVSQKSPVHHHVSDDGQASMVLSHTSSPFRGHISPVHCQIPPFTEDVVRIDEHAPYLMEKLEEFKCGATEDIRELTFGDVRERSPQKEPNSIDSNDTKEMEIVHNTANEVCDDSDDHDLAQSKIKTNEYLSKDYVDHVGPCSSTEALHHHSGHSMQHGELETTLHIDVCEPEDSVTRFRSLSDQPVSSLESRESDPSVSAAMDILGHSQGQKGRTVARANSTPEYDARKVKLASMYMANSNKPFNPFPVKHVNPNRAKTGVKLGLYKISTLQDLEKHTKKQPLWGK